MAQPVDPIDEILAELRHNFSNTLTMLNIVLRLRQNSMQLLGPTEGKLRCDLIREPYMVTLPVDETIPTSSVRCPGERRHALFLCGGREKRVCPPVRARVQSDDLALRVNCRGLADDSTRDMEAGQDAILIEKPITDRVFLEVVDADDLALPINRLGQRDWRRTFGMERSEDAGIIEKPILGNSIWTLWTIAPPANDLAPVVYGCRLGEYSTRDVEAGEDALTIQNSVSIPIEANADDLAPVVYG